MILTPGGITADWVSAGAEPGGLAAQLAVAPPIPAIRPVASGGREHALISQSQPGCAVLHRSHQMSDFVVRCDPPVEY